MVMASQESKNRLLADLKVSPITATAVIAMVPTTLMT